jgi:hypothetical protein
MNETVTIKYVIDQTIDLLKQVQVPMNLFDQIALPVNAAIGNLRACLDAISRSEREQEKRKEEQNGQHADAE